MGAALRLAEDQLSGSFDESVESAAEAMESFPTFCSLVEITPKDGGLIPFHYEDWHAEQRRFERDRTGSDIILKPRQVGFSTLELGRDLHFAVTRIGVSVVVVVHNRDAADGLFLVVKTMLDALRKVGLAPRTTYDNVRVLVFGDLRSSIRIVEAGATEKAGDQKGRSGTIHRLHITELAQWGAAQATLAAVLGCVPKGGEVVIESTARGAGGAFYELVQDAKDGRGPYRLHFFPWYQHAEYRLAVGDGFDTRPRDRWEEILRARGCDDEQIAWWREKVDNKAIGIEKALQEWPIDEETCFRAGGGHYITASAIDALAARVQTPLRVEHSLRFQRPSNGHEHAEQTLDIEARTYARAIAHRRYIVSGDPAEGVGGDGSSCTVLDAETGETVCTAWSDAIEAGDFGLALAVLGHRYNTALVVCERNNHGHAVLRALEREAQYPDHRIYRAEDRKRGWVTNAATRPPLFEDLRMAIEEGSAWTPDAATIGEARTIVKDPEDGRPRARNKGQAGGAKDDRFVSWGIGWQVRSKPLLGQRTWDAMAKLRAARMSAASNGDNQ